MVSQQELITRLTLAATTCTAIPILVMLAYVRWTRLVRRERSTWRNGASLTGMFLVFALWLIQSTRRGMTARHSELNVFLGANWTEVGTFLPAFYAYPPLPLALALKGAPRLFMVGAWLLLAAFYGSFWYYIVDASA
jgi:hypothetical protein